MKIMFTIALVSFAALAWAVFAMTHHIRKGALSSKIAETDPDLSHGLEARLNDIAKHPSARPVDSAPLANQNFSYFNKEASDEIYPAKRHIPMDPTFPAPDRT